MCDFTSFNRHLQLETASPTTRAAAYQGSAAARRTHGQQLGQAHGAAIHGGMRTLAMAALQLRPAPRVLPRLRSPPHRFSVQTEAAFAGPPLSQCGLCHSHCLPIFLGACAIGGLLQCSLCTQLHCPSCTSQEPVFLNMFSLSCHDAVIVLGPFRSSESPEK